ncbi:MAG TPA: helix-turn-helix domain-containing protein [Gryllotalpicola sp.]
MSDDGGVVSKGPLAPLGTLIVLRRYPAVGAATPVVRHYWVAEYALPAGVGRDVPILVYPACNLVVEGDRSRLYAPNPELTVQHLDGDGFAFGVLLQVATGFRVAARPLEEFLGDSIDLEQEPVTAAVRAIMMGPGEAEVRHPRAIAAFESWLGERVPSLSADDLLINAVAAAVESDPDLIRVDELAARFGLSTRRLERLVARYVGLTPKWLIRRRRLQDAAHRLQDAPGTELSRLAAELGYADYPHFSRDFAAVVGRTPREFADAAGSAATDPRAPG